MNIFESAAALRDRNIPLCVRVDHEKRRLRRYWQRPHDRQEDGGTIRNSRWGIAEFTVIKRAVAAIAERKKHPCAGCFAYHHRRSCLRQDAQIFHRA